MDTDNVLNFSRPDENRAFGGAAFEISLSAVERRIFHNKGIALLFAMLLSLGLWAGIWLAVAALVARAPF